MELQCKRPSEPLLTSYKVTKPFLRDVNSENEARDTGKCTVREARKRHTPTEVGSQHSECPIKTPVMFEAQ